MQQLSLKLCAFFFLLSFTVYSKATDLLVVGAEHKMLQYQENGTHKGTTINMLSEIMLASHLSYNIELMPWARAFNIAENRSNTLILSMIRTAEREQNFHWLLKVSESVRTFISLKNKPENKVSSEVQAKKKTIAVVRGSHADIELKTKGFSTEKNIYLVSSHKQMISLFAAGKVDLVYSDPDIVQAYLKNHNSKLLLIDFSPIKPDQRRDSYIATNKHIDAKLLQRIRIAVEKFQRTEKYKALLNKL